MPLARIVKSNYGWQTSHNFQPYYWCLQDIRHYIAILCTMTYRFPSAHKSHLTPPCCIARFHVANYGCYRARIRRVSLSVPPRRLRRSIAIPKVIWVFRPWTLRRMTRFDRLRGFGRKSLPAEAKFFFTSNLASPTTFYPLLRPLSLSLHRILKTPPFITVKWGVLKTLSHAASLLHLQLPSNLYLFSLAITHYYTWEKIGNIN